MQEALTGERLMMRTFESFVKAEAIHKGWSDDKKYCVETADGEKRLLRISDITVREEKEREFALMKRMAAAGIPASQPLEFGVCDDGKSVCQLLTWCEGTEAKELLPSLSEKEQYAYGEEAGRILKRMENVEYYQPSDAWAEEYGTRAEGYIDTYLHCCERMIADDLMIHFVRQHKSCLLNRPRALLHADFQTDNMVISRDGKLLIIDFQGSGLVDPYYALAGVMVSAENSPAFSCGQLHSYFGGEVPDDFWELNAFYLAAECINAFSVAVKLGQEEIDYSNEMMKTTLGWFNNMNCLIPSWYRRLGGGFGFMRK